MDRQEKRIRSEEPPSFACGLRSRQTLEMEKWEKKKSEWCLGSEDDEGREVEAEGGREQSSAAAAC